MVLCIENREYNQSCSLDKLLNHSNLIELSKQFALSTEYTENVDDISHVLYIGQYEYGVLNKNDPNELYMIGSDDATTCHIIIIEQQDTVALAHLDGRETQNSIDSICRELKRYQTNNFDYNVYLVGGFLDNSRKQYSNTLSNEVLNVLAKNEQNKFHLKLAAITPHNDYIKAENNTHYPYIYGVLYDIRNNQLKKMTFIDNGPGSCLRSLRGSEYSLPLLCVYSSLNGYIFIDKFSVNSTHYQQYRYLYDYYYSNDKSLLKVTSTSPEQERPSYLKMMRNKIVYILKYYQQIDKWFDNETSSIIYKKDPSTHQWITNSPVVE
ncbi:unnamed protein product [Didymodactylos carnosus]|uniref:Uncharacterized protein n=1 Tax=Didymodactylos carnosus TaxID=1234261 RepID=A0A814C4X5_9BILA|nr:unnamed protein product [Didymodactylos carnosus]CAF1371058.1 unnamed protein product [Didymodactylos carnosus]CAF3713280.1 unnamed protein product [Didymodactylos carnosus]CAF4180215.1 unnamed protein product [Didymodactylos carnosus]